MDWVDWHADYDVPDSKLAHRLRIVQARIRTALDAMPAGPRTAVSLCAGQGRDLIGVLAGHPRGGDVRARLVELDQRNVNAARAAARAAGLDGVEVVRGDAGLTDCYAGAVPADLVVACGVFGNLTDEDVLATVDACRALCARGGTVVWTRHRGAPDRVPATCARFEEGGFERLFLTPPEVGFSVGAHRHAGDPVPLRPGRRMFTFVGAATLRAMVDP
ncbi:SAM-dependent methyltransferase [Jidongwangia harbinensis]|uniref:SAM-dependent methyltransferase n=1 Tax=Jidongwangia harbinensis TaxID=2878561 RepID=UPI001CD93A29|nr:SAM-dependent methyltransferase [Jidongwangia harbinensis]MCA2216391.1 SAM-dependent methyltransferase [Jidongwangia harbinensis]